MIKLLSSIFECNQYKVHPVDFNLSGFNSALVVPNKLSSKKEFFFLLEHDCVSDEIINDILLKYSSMFHSKLNDHPETNETFRKNVTMIFCCKSKDISSSNLLKFEENPFDFKKNVITYEEEQLIEIKNIFSDNELSVDYINSLIGSNYGQVFDMFKNNKLERNHYYPLLMNIVTKLPIINYIQSNIDLDDLNLEINKQLSDDEIKMKSFMFNLDLNKDKNELDAILLGDWVGNE